VPDQVKTRPYSGDARRREAAARRLRIVRAASELFAERGWAGTAMADVAQAAGVALDTVYASVGRKPQLLLAVHDLLLGEGTVDEDGAPLPAVQRRYVADVRAAESARAKIAVYAQALTRVLPRTAPVSEALRQAGQTDDRCRGVWEELQQRRADNMRLLVADLRDTGDLRPDLDDDTVADLMWSMNDAGYFTSLASRGWTPEQYGEMVRDVWTRTLLV
jgi:AcrR family transcriptional regulator